MTIQKKNKNKQARKEAKATIFVYLLYFFFSVGTAYGLGRDIENYTYILGFPAWFFYSCILAYFFVCIAVYILIRTVFSHKEER